MSVKNRAKRLASLGRDRLVDLDGKLVKRIAEHPAFANCCKSAAAVVDSQATCGA